MCMISPSVPIEVAHNGLYISQGAEKDYMNDIGSVTRGNNVKCIGTLFEMRYVRKKYYYFYKGACYSKTNQPLFPYKNTLTMLINYYIF